MCKHRNDKDTNQLLLRNREQTFSLLWHSLEEMCAEFPGGV